MENILKELEDTLNTHILVKLEDVYNHQKCLNNINNFNDELEKVFKNLIEKARNSIKSELESTKEV